MAKIPTIRRLSVEDFPSQKSWIGKFFEVLNNFIISVVAALNNQLTFTENMVAQVDKIRVRTSSGYVPGDQVPSDISDNFTDADVNTGTSTITITGHQFSTGDIVRFTTTGVLPSGLATNADFWVIVAGPNEIQLASSFADAINGTAITISSASGGGTHTVTEWLTQPAYLPLFEPARISLRFKALPVLVMLGSVTEVSSNSVIIRQPTTIDWSYQNGLVTINNVTGLSPSRQYDLVVLISGG